MFDFLDEEAANIARSGERQSGVRHVAGESGREGTAVDKGGNADVKGNPSAGARRSLPIIRKPVPVSESGPLRAPGAHSVDDHDDDFDFLKHGSDDPTRIDVRNERPVAATLAADGGPGAEDRLRRSAMLFGLFLLSAGTVMVAYDYWPMVRLPGFSTAVTAPDAERSGSTFDTAIGGDEELAESRESATSASALSRRFLDEREQLEALIAANRLDEAEQALSQMDRTVYGYGFAEFSAFESRITTARAAGNVAVTVDAESGSASEAERAAAAAQVAEEARIAEVERERVAEEMRIAEAERQAEKARVAEAERLAEEARVAEVERLAAEARVAEAERLAEETRVAEAERLAEETRVAEAERLAEETRVAEAERLAEEARVAEAERLAEEARVAEAERLAEEARLAEAERLAEEARVAEAERQAADARVAEAERQAEAARVAERERQAEDARVTDAARLAEDARIAEAERVAAEARFAASRRATDAVSGTLAAPAIGSQRAADAAATDALVRRANVDAGRAQADPDDTDRADTAESSRVAARAAVRERALDVERERAARTGVVSPGTDGGSRNDADRRATTVMADRAATDRQVAEARQAVTRPAPGDAPIAGGEDIRVESRPEIGDEDFELIYGRFKALERAVEQRDIQTVISLTRPSGARIQQLLQVFENSEALDARITNVSMRKADEEISGVLRIDSVRRNDGSRVRPPPGLEAVSLTSSRDSSGWSALIW